MILVHSAIRWISCVFHICCMCFQWTLFVYDIVCFIDLSYGFHIRYMVVQWILFVYGITMVPYLCICVVWIHMFHGFLCVDPHSMCLVALCVPRDLATHMWIFRTGYPLPEWARYKIGRPVRHTTNFLMPIFAWMCFSTHICALAHHAAYRPFRGQIVL